MPRLSVMLKWRSYPGAGHRNFTPEPVSLSSIHGRGESTPPCSIENTTASYIISRLELLRAMRLATGMPNRSPKMARRPGNPCGPP